MRRVLKGLKAFNEFNLKSCYYNQLVSGYSLFGADPQIIAADYLPLYEFDQDNHLLSIRNMEVLREEDRIALTGVAQKQHRNINEVREFIAVHIDRRMPIILPVDCFYLHYREDTYQKVHRIHFVLIYGYDTDEKIYFINDHLYLNSKEYKKHKVSISDILTAYKEFVNKLQKETSFPVTVLFKKGKANGDFATTYKNNLRRLGKDIKNSWLAFQNFIRSTKSLAERQEVTGEKADNTANMLRDLRQPKMVQRNILSYVFRNEWLNHIADRVVEDYIFVYGIMVKARHYGKYSEKDLVKFLARADELEELETKLHGFLAEGV